MFPPTYAGGTYNIDYLGDEKLDKDQKQVPTPNVCLIDSVGSQANRIEPAFKNGKLAELVPQVTVEFEDGDIVNLLDAGHRIADAAIRFSSLAEAVEDALLAYREGDAEPLARLAPTTEVFGAWDSRATQVKLPRIVAATIRAYDVRELRRSAQYNPPKDYTIDETLDDYARDKESKKDGKAEHVNGKPTKHRYSQEGLLDNPGGTFAHGGVIADRIIREATLNLATIRDLRAGDGKDKGNNEALQRYILGLALIAVTYLDGRVLSLRQGCQLVCKGKADREVIGADGTLVDKPPVPSRGNAIDFATAAALEFGIEKIAAGTFNRKEAERILKMTSDAAKKERQERAVRRAKRNTKDSSAKAAS